MSCCTLANNRFSFSKCSLVLCNLIFSLVGAILLAASLYVRFDTHWSALFNSPTSGFSTLYLLMGVGGVILFLSVLGARAAVKESKFLLCLYLIVVLGALCAQIFAATVLYQLNDTVSTQLTSKTGISAAELTGFQADVLQKIGNSTVNFYEQGKCTTITDSTSSLTIKCNTSNTGWFEKFVNTQCKPEGASWDSADLQQCTAAGVSDGANNVGGVAVWCKCMQAVSAEVQRYSKPLMIVAFVVAGIELLLVCAASYMICCYNKRKAEEERLTEEAQRGYMAQPKVTQQGINMV